MLKRFLNWWLCLNEPQLLHKTKIEFFKKAKEANIKHIELLWNLAKSLYPASLADGEIDEIISSARG